MSTILLIQFLSCAFMTGVIWLVQILVYPNFRLISEPVFKEFHEFHTNRITWVVAPAMLLELSTGVWLSYFGKEPIYFWNLLSIFVVWILTGFVSVPLHNLLHTKPESKQPKDWLVWTNWPRTTAWSMRLLFLLWLINKNVSGVIQ